MKVAEQHFRIAMTYGGYLGRLVRRLGYNWNHVYSGLQYIQEQLRDILRLGERIE